MQSNGVTGQRTFIETKKLGQSLEDWSHAVATSGDRRLRPLLAWVGYESCEARYALKQQESPFAQLSIPCHLNVTGYPYRRAG